MEGLVNCSNCGHKISDTALKCPACFKDTGASEIFFKNITASNIAATGAAVALMVLTGPLTIAAVLADYRNDAHRNKQIKQVAKELDAIDSIQFNSEVILVTNDKFIPAEWPYLGVAQAEEYPYFLRSDLHSVRIERDVIKKKFLSSKKINVLHVDFFHTSRKKPLSYDYMFENKNEKVRGEIAFIKFREYQIPQVEA